MNKSATSQIERVVLLHGLARSARSMNKLQQAFARAGYDVVNAGYPSRSATVEVLVDRVLAPVIRQAQEEVAQLHFVTHSMGGILLRYYISQQAIPCLGRVVMLGPPNQGSEVVDVFGRVPGFKRLNGPAGLQLGTRAQSLPLAIGRAEFDVGVIAGTKSVNPILSLTLEHPNDGKVSVERAKLDGMSDFLCVPVSHPFLMRSDLVIQQSMHFIRHGCFESATENDGLA